VVLISDGEGDPQRLSIPAGPIRLVAIGTGPASKSGHRLLRSASRTGNGPYVYLDSVERANALQFDRLFFSVANDVSVKLTLPSYFTVERPFSGSLAAPDQVEKQYLAPDQVSVFLFRLLACHPSVAAELDFPVSASVAYTRPGEAEPISSPEQWAYLSNTQPQLDKSYAVLTYAEALRSLDGRRLEHALSVVHQANAAAPDAELSAIAELLSLHPGMPQAE
jgi:hypothetical protein